jgi:hypothetical protein
MHLKTRVAPRRPELEDDDASAICSKAGNAPEWHIVVFQWRADSENWKRELWGHAA